MKRPIVHSVMFRQPVIGERINIFPDEPKKYKVIKFEILHNMVYVTSEELEPYEVEEGVEYIETPVNQE